MEEREGVKAMVHSKNAMDTVTIISHKDNNHVIAEYKGVRYTAIFNIFRQCYYVDDIYGRIGDWDMGLLGY